MLYAFKKECYMFSWRTDIFLHLKTQKNEKQRNKNKVQRGITSTNFIGSQISGEMHNIISRYTYYLQNFMKFNAVDSKKFS